MGQELLCTESSDDTRRGGLCPCVALSKILPSFATFSRDVDYIIRVHSKSVGSAFLFRFVLAAGAKP